MSKVVSLELTQYGWLHKHCRTVLQGLLLLLLLLLLSGGTFTGSTELKMCLCSE